MPLAPSDLFSIIMVLDPQIAPDAGCVYFRRTQLDRDLDTATGSVWRTRVNEVAQPFTNGRDDRLPRLSPDGTQLAFVGERDGTTRLMLIATGGGEAHALGDAFTKPGSLAWSPDGSHIAVVSIAPHDAVTARSFHDERSGARHIRALPFKSDSDGLLDGRRKQISIVDVSTGVAAQLTAGDYDVGGLAWSPDGRQIVFAASIGRAEDDANGDIHVVTVATGERRMLTAGAGTASNPSWSHDGDSIAFLGHVRGNAFGGRFNTELFIIGAAGGAQRSLSEQIDRTAGDVIIGDMRPAHGAVSPVWSSDDREILVQISDQGACTIRAFAADGSGSRLAAGGERDIFSFSCAPDGTLAIAYSTPTVPAAIAIVSAAGAETQLAEMNAAFLKTRCIAEPRRFRPRAHDGTMLDAWLLPAATNDEQQPLVLQVHGGPHYAYGFSFFFEFHVIAGAGCAVAFGNPRGSQAYGQGYADAITGDWGGIDAGDIHAILDGALELGAFDPARIGVAGGSYGGFMTSWLLGHSKRFAAGVSMRAVNDFVSEVGASDFGWVLESEIQAPSAFADGGRRLFDASPMRSAGEIDAPLLVMHSERDYRCPIDQGEQLFTILRRLGKTRVEFVRFTGDGHELSRAGKPRNRVLRLRAIAHWFIRHLGPGGIPGLAPEAGALFAPIPHEVDVYAAEPKPAAS
jgi:dipeptidyl aminopeptidase/acylaminoacyl peptidase